MEEEWKEVSTIALTGWLGAHGLFMLHAIKDEDGFLLLDHILFEMGLLQKDKTIASVVKTIGWVIMVLASVWLVMRSRTREDG